MRRVVGRSGGAPLQRIRWALRRARAMPRAEWPHRVREALQRHRDRSGALAEEVRAGVRPLVDRPLPAWPLRIDEVHEVFDDAARARLGAEVDAILSGRFALLGVERPAGSRTDWHLDPQSGRHWPAEAFTFDIPYRHGDRDPKLPWELMRLGHLQLLALGAAVLGRADARRAVLGDLADFCQANPPFRGLAWTCGIECAQRVASLLVVVGLLGDDAFGPDLRRRIWEVLALHGAWIARYPSLHSAANNHLVAESGALYLLACLAPDLPGAGAWRRDAERRLNQEAEHLIFVDGAGAEQSPSYQAFTMEWLLAARHVGRTVDADLLPQVTDGLRMGAHFLAAICDREGHPPAFGDDDGGRVLWGALEEPGYVLSVNGATAAQVRRVELRHPAWRPDLRAALLREHDRDGTRRPRRARQVFEARSRTFAEGGWTVFHHERPGGEVHLVFDHGPLGLPPLAAHGHADALAIWLHVDGRPVLVDAGTWRYHAGEGWRRWFRSTAAHNTIEIDGRDQSEQAGAFQWERRARTETVVSAIHRGVVAARHDGYAGLGVVHRRTVEMTGPEGARVTDDLEGRGRHRIASRLHFAPDLEVAREADGAWVARAEGRPLVRVRLEGPDLQAQVERQADRPGPGAHSPAPGHLVAAPVLTFSGTLDLPVRLVLHLSFPLEDA